MPQQKSAFARLRPYLTPPNIISAAALIAAITVAGVFLYVNKTPADSTVTVVRGSLTEEVDATGMVKPTESVDLGFQRGGTIASIPVVVGSHVVPGQTLATLANSDLRAARSLAAANLAVAQAKLSSIQSGTRPEALATARAAVAQALEQGYLAADDALHNKVDQFITNPRSLQPQLEFLVSDSQLALGTLASRVLMEGKFSSLQNTLVSGDVSSETDLVARAGEAEQDLIALQVYLNTVTDLLTKAIPSNNIPMATILTYEQNVAVGRTEVSQALSALNAAQGQLSLDEAGATAQDIEGGKAAVDAAQAALDAANAQLSQTAIAAPIGGVVVRQDGNAGEVVSPGQSFLSLNSDARFEIEAYVSEADVAKITKGIPATVRLDAYPNDSFDAAIVAVDPAATMQNGVPSYKVTAQFTGNDARIKAGLTANLSIAAGKADNALLIPSSALITRGTDIYVMKINQSGAQELTPVTTGIGNSAGQTQVLSGLSEGDRIVSFGTGAQTQ